MVLTNNTSEFSALGLGLEVLEKTEAYVVLGISSDLTLDPNQRIFSGYQFSINSSFGS